MFFLAADRKVEFEKAKEEEQKSSTAPDNTVSR
jgi:hypothetical protein